MTLAAQSGPSSIEDHEEVIMKCPPNRNDEVSAFRAQRSERDQTIQVAEALIRSAEAQMLTEPQQRDVAMALAGEVNTGSDEVFQRYERERES